MTTWSAHRRRRWCALAAIGGLAVAACAGDSSSNPDLQSLDRPTDVAFTCFGALRITDGGLATLEQPVLRTSQPMASCQQRALPVANESDLVDTPAGQQELDPIRPLQDTFFFWSFILQSVPGTVAVASSPVRKPGQPIDQRYIAIQDANPLTPGKNSLSVGILPIAIAADASGCHMITANAGSCDLSIIDANRAITRAPEPAVRRQAIVTPGGVTLKAKPAAMIAAAPDRLIGRACPAEPDSLVFIAYPDCHAVAVVESATGRIQSSIRFAADGTASIGDGDLACAAECGGSGTITDGARPVTLDVVRDAGLGRPGTIRLAIGLDNRPVVTVVDLDADWIPVTLKQVELDGDVGVLDLAISPQLGVGGGTRIDDDATGTDQAQFVYAVATDGSVRVAEVLDTDSECDTQSDPRFLLEVGDSSRFTCLPVGLPGTPPRRALADGPGIRPPGDAVPVSVVIVRSGLGESMPPALSPSTLRGTFAFLGMSSGEVAVVNVDDDNYEDVQLTAADPFATQLALATPHQLRDGFPNRVARTQIMVGNTARPLCKSNGLVNTAGGPRVLDAPSQVVRSTGIAAEKAFAMPFLRQVECEGWDRDTNGDGTPDPETAAVSEIAINAPDGVRLETFPDWGGLSLDETWSLTWEGSLSNDTIDTVIDGPAVRQGYIEVAGGGMAIHDPARPFCAIGVEDRDTVVLRGCDPTRGDAQCGAGQTCFVHPDSTQASGACLPKDQLAELVGPCRDFLVSPRRFAIKRAFADEVELIERRRALRTTPVTGCESVQQCQALATYEDSLLSAKAPVDDTTPASPRTFACEPDPSRPLTNGAAINRCIQTCTASTECGGGGHCSGGRCLEAPVPPPACVVGAQRYEFQASDAFVMLGNRNGYLHGMKEDRATGRCVKDPTASPLLAGRIPLAAPPCGPDLVSNVAPNPCTISVEQADELPVYTPGTCTQTDTAFLLRSTPAIRFRNPAMTLNLVDGTYPGDARCLNDRGGSLVGVPTAYAGYQIRFRQIAGLAPLFVSSDNGRLRASYISRLVRGPDRGIWMVDEGDLSTSVVNARGAVFRFGVDPLGGPVVSR